VSDHDHDQLPRLDEPPQRWVEHDDLELTPEEIDEGNRLGRVIDPDDDEDAGLESGASFFTAPSGFSLALTQANLLRSILLDHGVARVSIELQPGRPGTPNAGWFAPTFMGNMGHHIVSTRAMGLTPGLRLVKAGRTDVPGPLCNAYGGFDETARIICMGWANHPGAGGPLSLPGGVVPRDGARPYMFGWEHEGGVRLSDWPDRFRTFMGRCHAATLAWLKADARSHAEHLTWAPTRKIDRLGYTTATGRAEAHRHRKTTTPAPPDWESDGMQLYRITEKRWRASYGDQYHGVPAALGRMWANAGARVLPITDAYDAYLSQNLRAENVAQFDET
jgi:hypothetical protein